jgi:hypothetical protein
MYVLLLYVLALFLGALEIAFTVWLMTLVLNGIFIGYIGLICYLIFSTLFLGKSIQNNIITIVSSFVLGFIFNIYGLIWAIASFIALIIIFEFFPKNRS